MTSEDIVRETIKIPVHALKMHLSGTVLELVRETGTYYDYKTIDMSKYNVHLRGVDSEGFLILEILPLNASTKDEGQEMWVKMHGSKDFQPTDFNPKMKRMHGDVAIPQGYSPYDEIPTKLGGIHKIYVNQRRNFLVRVETSRGGSRLHNLGELGDPKSWIGKFKAKFEDDWRDWMEKEEIKAELRDARMFDNQKLTTGLHILIKEGLIKKRGNAYVSINLFADEIAERSNLEEGAKQKS